MNYIILHRLSLIRYSVTTSLRALYWNVKLSLAKSSSKRKINTYRRMRKKWVQKTLYLTPGKICSIMSRFALNITKPVLNCCIVFGLITNLTITNQELQIEGFKKTSIETLRAAVINEVYPPIKTIPDNIAEIDLTNPQYFEWISLESFERALPATMRPYAQLYYEEGLHHEINFIFMAAKDSLESAYFTSNVFLQTNNAGGWTKQNGEFREFSSPAAYISYSYDAIGSMYMTPGAAHFKGYSIDSINKAYNGKQEWADAVSIIYKNYLKQIINYEEK